MTKVPLLRERANQIYDSQIEIFEHVSREMNVTKAEIIEGFVRYNSEVETLDNDAYEDPTIRIAMYMEYILAGSWHQERQVMLYKFIEHYQPATIIDIGFGAPMKYAREYVLNDQSNLKRHLTLADKFPSSFDFARIILSYWDPSYAEKIDFKIVDLADISFVGNYDAYILQDAIEHAPEPEKYLKNIAQHCAAEAIILLSLPIAPLIPCHFIHWLKEEDALAWVESCGLTILNKERVYANPEVDWFAESLGEIYNLMLVTKPALEAVSKGKEQ